MGESIFKHIECGQTLPIDNVHAVSVSMPKIQDVIDYENQTPEILEIIKSGYPRFILHPYLKQLALFIEKKYIFFLCNQPPFVFSFCVFSV